MKRPLMALRRYFLADDDEEIHWGDYAWLVFGYGSPVLITIYTIMRGVRTDGVDVVPTSCELHLARARV